MPEIIDAKFKVIRPKRGFRFDWRPMLGAAILGLSALVRAFSGHH